MSTSHALLKFFRKLHLYIGVFITPALLFFAFTGALQTFSLHEKTASRPDYTPPSWAVTLGQIHKKQTSIVPPKKPRPDDAPKPAKHDHADTTASGVAATPAAPSAPPAPVPMAHLPLKFFFGLVALGLFTSTLTGLYMAYKYTRNTLVLTALLIAGVIVPILLLPF